MHRLFATLLSAVLGWGAVTPLECAGWQPTAKQRMDCCARAKHECPDQSIADNCCSRSEESQQERTAVQSFILLPPAPSVALFAPVSLVQQVSRATTLWFESRIDGRPQRPTYLITSVLLI